MDEIDLTSPVPLPQKRPKRALQSNPVEHRRNDVSLDLPLKDMRATSSTSDGSSEADLSRSCSLTYAQSAIVEIARRGDSFFFSGCAGTGKTFTLRAIIDALPDVSTYITATTGIAASLLPRGTTLHSFAGIGHGEGPQEMILKKVKQNQKVATSWKNAKTLIIDEVSMLSKELFELLDYIARELRHKKTVPFGGIQVICCGDFFQLPPVSRKQTDYCFESPIWVSFIGKNSFELLDIFRQKDPRLIDLLNDIRYGNIRPETLTLVDSMKREITLPSGITPTLLVPMNATADAINMTELQKLSSEKSCVYQSHDWAADPHTLELLSKLTLFPEKLPLRIGAQVMLLKNQSALTLWNGSRGVVIALVDRATLDKMAITIIESSNQGASRFPVIPIVRFSSGQEVAVGMEVFELEGFGNDGKSRKSLTGNASIRARRLQIPLRLSWAITIHKSQGMSLDYLKVDCCRSFEAGQAYVALSRARTVDGLQILSFDPRKCWCDPRVVEFYKSGIRKLSSDVCDGLVSTRKGAKKRHTKTLKPPEEPEIVKKSTMSFMTDWISNKRVFDSPTPPSPSRVASPSPPPSQEWVDPTICSTQRPVPCTTQYDKVSAEDVEELFRDYPVYSTPPSAPSRPLPLYCAPLAYEAYVADMPPLPSPSDHI